MNKTKKTRRAGRRSTKPVTQRGKVVTFQVLSDSWDGQVVSFEGHELNYDRFKETVGWAPPLPEEGDFEGPAIKARVLFEFSPQQALRAKIRGRRSR